MGRLRLRVRNAATFAPLPAVKTALARGIARSLEVGKSYKGCVGWCITGFYVDIFCPWTIHETCRFEPLKGRGFLLTPLHLQVSNRALKPRGMNIQERISIELIQEESHQTGIEENWHPGTRGMFSFFPLDPRAPLLCRGPIMRGSFSTINLADPSLFPTWKYCSTWNYREERCDLK